jgi:hypothetical protein
MIWKANDDVPRMVKAALLVGPLLVAVLASGCSGTPKPTATSAEAVARSLSASTALPDLQHPGRPRNLFALFNRDGGVPRLVLLVSPT